MKPIVTFFGTQPYEQESFDALNRDFGFEFRYFKGHLSRQTVVATHGAQAACIFVNDTADAEVMRELARNGVRLLALRCAGYNNVDLEAARTFNIPVVRVPAYSPHAVAEHAVALMLALNRKVHRAYWRTRDGNFSLHGLMGFDMYGKTAGIIGTGKIARELIRILKGFGMKVLAYDIFPDAEYAAQAQVEFVIGRIETALAVERRVDRLAHRTPPCRAHPGRLAQHLARRERQRHFGGGDQRLPVASDRKAQPFACREHEGQTTVGTLHFIGFDRCGRSAEKRRRGQCQQKKSFHIESGLVVCRIRR